MAEPAREASRIGELLAGAVPRLEPVSDTPALDAQLLLGHATGRERTWVLAHPEAVVNPQQAGDFENLLTRRLQGEPLPYLLGRWEFYGLELEITPEVLIPRPETELLVEQAVQWLRRRPASRLAADIGTGSGCIAVALAANVPDLQVIATDISPQALQVARRNAERLGVADRVDFHQADLLAPFPHAPPSYALICANLPYIPSRALRGLPVYGREPSLALDGGTDGLDLIRRLLQEAPRCLTRGGLILLEIEASQGLKALSLAYDAFHKASISLLQDLAGQDRLLRIEV
jgi:release factor glutamine methyltransferase